LEDGEAVWAAKPHTFMNLSGDMVQPLARYYRIASEEILVVSDDMELPLGKLRIRLKGSAGGQNGLRSILERLGTQQIPRLRLGVGPRPEGMDAAAFVLSRFGQGDAGAVERMIERASEAIAAVCRDGVERSMNAFNGSEPA
jgi:PTH1 family peptidyl-tRNA hydrolase